MRERAPMAAGAMDSDEVAEAEAQGLPYALVPQGFERPGMDRKLWRAGPRPRRVRVINDRTGLQSGHRVFASHPRRSDIVLVAPFTGS